MKIKVKKEYTFKELLDKYNKGDLRLGRYIGYDGNTKCYVAFLERGIGAYREFSNGYTEGVVPFDSKFKIYEEKEVTEDTILKHIVYIKKNLHDKKDKSARFRKRLTLSELIEYVKENDFAPCTVVSEDGLNVDFDVKNNKVYLIAKTIPADSTFIVYDVT